MRAGYFTMPLHPPGSDPAITLATDLAQIVELDRLGYDEAWIGEHVTSVWENIPAPDLFIAQALALTKNIKLATGVSCLPNHNPLMLAQRIAQLDNMAKGRFYWGIGSGGFPGDFQMLDLDPKSLAQRAITRETLDCVLDLWDNPTPGIRDHARWHFVVPAEDDVIGVKLHMRPYQKPYPPIGVAGIGPKSDMLTLAGERGWIPISINTVVTSTLKAHWDTYAASAAANGRTVSRKQWRISRDVFVGETSAEARRAVLEGPLARDWRDYFLHILRRTSALIGPKIDPNMSDDEVTIDYLLENLWIVGDVDEVTAKLQKLYDDVGGFGTLLVIGHEWDPGDVGHKSMDLLINKVLPRLPSVA